MPPLKIILFGGNTQQVNAIFKISSGIYEIRHLPINYKLITSDLKFKAGLMLIIHNPPENNGIAKLRNMKKKFPGVPMLLLADQLSQQDILSAFRLGAADVLTFPLHPEEYASAIKYHIISRPEKGFLSGAFFRKAIDRFKGWLGFMKEQRLIPVKDSRLKALGLMPNTALTSFPVERKEGRCDIHATLFGNLEVVIRGKSLPKIAGKKVNSLLAYLLHHHQKPIMRDILMEKFWGCTSPSSARNSLNVAIHSIRKHFAKILPEQDFLIYHNERYSVNPELDILTDAEQFYAYCQKGRITEQTQGLEYALGAYNKAIALYRGDFLDEFLYDEWCEQERDNLKETYLLILDRQSAYFFNQGAYSVAINICKKMLQKDSCLEEVHRRLIISFNQLGLRDKAIRQYQKCEQCLMEELNIEPTPQTKALLEEIRAEIVS